MTYNNELNKQIYNKTYHLSRKVFSGCKYSKIRLTDMAAANATVEKLLMFFVGKSTNSLPIQNPEERLDDFSLREVGKKA